jgi:rubredoxin
MNPDITPTPRWVIKKGDFDGKPYLWDDRKYDNYDLGSLCRILNEYEEKNNKVARLRELLNRAIGYTKNALFFARTYDNKIQWNEIDKLWDEVRDLEKETLATAPEETVTEKASKFSVNPSFYEKCNVCGESYGDHTGHPDDPHCPLQEPVSDWKCPHCGSTTGTWFSRVEPMGDICEDCGKSVDDAPAQENEVERLKEMVMEVARRGDEMVTQARKAHFETCKNAQSAIEKLHTENICLQELIQEFYEWSRRDYPTEAEVREIMDRYYNLLNHNSNEKAKSPLVKNT